MSADEIRLSSRNVSVPWEKRSELMQRLEGMEGGSEAAAELRTRHAFAESRKPLVYAVLDAWLREVGKDAFGEELDQLRLELHRDIAQKG